MPGDSYSAIYELAADQFGYVTSAQARDAGITPMALVMMERRATLERVSRGVYRLAQFPHGPLAEYMEAALWPAGVTGVISHESALALYAVSDVNPARIHLTVPTRFRIRRPVPSRMKIHHADLSEGDQAVHEGIPVTSFSRTIRDCVSTSLGGALIRQAVEDAERIGVVSRQAAVALRKELDAAER